MLKYDNNVYYRQYYCLEDNEILFNLSYLTKIGKIKSPSKIRKCCKDVLDAYQVEYCYLFGSYAKGTEKEDSDIDIAIISSDFKDVIEDGANLIGYTWKIDTRIEPHPITTEDYENIANPFVKEVIDTGIKVA